MVLTLLWFNVAGLPSLMHHHYFYYARNGRLDKQANQGTRYSGFSEATTDVTISMEMQPKQLRALGEWLLWQTFKHLPPDGRVNTVEDIIEAAKNRYITSTWPQHNYGSSQTNGGCRCRLMDQKRYNHCPFVTILKVCLMVEDPIDN